ncbi:MAG: hypothetical protein WD066_08400 [Planctomycetaceae bacterium]
MTDRIFPYETLHGDVRLGLAGGGLDDHPWPRDPYTQDRRLVELYDLDKDDWRIAQFEMDVTLPSDELEKLNERGADVRAIAVVECSRTCYRETVRLQPSQDEPARWTGTLELERANFHGKTTVHALVVGEIDGYDNRFLGLSEAWALYFNEPDVPPLAGTMRVSWVDFDEPVEELRFLRDFREHPFFTDLQSDQPTLFLNRATRFEGLPALLDDRRRTTGERALHDGERVSIVRTVWMAMVNAAIASIRVDDDGIPDWPVEDWKRAVLRMVLARVYATKSESELLIEAFEAWKSNERAGELESRVQVAIDDMITAGKLLRRTLDYMRSAQS